MKRWLILLLIPTAAWAATPITQTYEKEQDTFREFRNVYDQLQDRQFTQISVSTPNVSDLRDGEIVIYVSTPNTPTTPVFLILRAGTTLYASPRFNIIQGR